MNLVKKDILFHYEKNECNAFQMFKDRLINAPVLSIYSLLAETELHCASTLDFGTILVQKKADRKFHPIFIF